MLFMLSWLFARALNPGGRVILKEPPLLGGGGMPNEFADLIGGGAMLNDE